MDEAKRDYWIEHFTWEGIKIEAKYEADWNGCNAKYGHNNAHLEIRSLEPKSAPLPITQTGYLSVFHTPGMIELTAGPAAYVLEWLTREADKPAWKATLAPKQLDLFA
jgi:hypothetical protein